MKWLKKFFGLAKNENYKNRKDINIKDERIVEEMKEGFYSCPMCMRKLSKKDF